MAFKTWDNQHLARFNSAISSKFLDNYTSYVDSTIKAKAERPSHQTFSGSSFRCDRRSWFRLRGTEPDSVKAPDKVLNFTADIGTACHRIIQNNLRAILKDDWIDVGEYLAQLQPDYAYEVTKDDDGIESQVCIFDPPIRFACDGIVIYNGITYLLEIKTSELSSWQTLTTAKLEHVDQVKAYSALLKLPNVLMIYQERQYGGLKCFELKVPQSAWDDTFHRFSTVMDCVKTNIAPEGLPVGDKWCTPSYCPYYKKCQEYGR